MQRLPEGFGLRQSPAALAFAFFAIASALPAAVPTLDHLYPIAIPRGATSAVTAIGTLDPWPPPIWLDTSGITFKAETNSGKFTIEVATNAALGPHIVRAWNDAGASSPRFLVITDTEQLAEREPNDDWAKPQRIETFPAHISGRLDKANDVDSYATHLKGSATLTASLQAHVLASPVDAVLRLVDHRGVEVA